ncbi:MAG: LysR family transcriptional regulator [Bryobacterales bacterium]|nr:LysR family transcriptional regulator [Bryobacterales bacterium]
MEIPEAGLDRADMRALVAIHMHGHFTRAAAALGISQPALTKRIRRLENRLGGLLFERHPRGATPTAAGQLLCGRARSLLEDAAKAEESTLRVLAGESGELRIGAGLSVLLSGLPDVLRVFRRQCPGVHLTVRDMSTRAQAAALRSGELDIGFVRAGDESGGLHTVPVMRDELRIACPAGLVRGRSVDLAAVYRQPLVVVSRAVSPTFHDHVLATCRAVGYSPQIVQEANQLLAVLMLVQAGAGISLVPRSVQVLSLPRVRILPHSLPLGSWTIGIAWSRQPGASPAMRNFVRMARQLLAAPKLTVE